MTLHQGESAGQRSTMPPDVSIVVLAWDQLELTSACVDSIRSTSDVHHELIVVDNGSAPEAREYARHAADIAVLNDTNVGFAAGNNAGLARASAPTVMFLNNDTVLPQGWTRLIRTLEARSDAGIVVPALTTAGTQISVRDEPRDHVEAVLPFGPAPSGVCYLMHTEVIRALGGWNESYPVASGEDLDLAFTVWVNDLEIVLDEAVLVEHVGHGTSSVKLPDRERLWKENHRLFLRRWQDLDADVVRLDTCPVERFERNRRVAAAVASWRDRYQRHRDRADVLTTQRDAARREAATAEARLDALMSRRRVRWALGLPELVKRRRPSPSRD